MKISILLSFPLFSFFIKCEFAFSILYIQNTGNRPPSQDGKKMAKICLPMTHENFIQGSFSLVIHYIPLYENAIDLFLLLQTDIHIHINTHTHTHICCSWVLMNAKVPLCVKSKSPLNFGIWTFKKFSLYYQTFFSKFSQIKNVNI